MAKIEGKERERRERKSKADRAPCGYNFTEIRLYTRVIAHLHRLIVCSLHLTDRHDIDRQNVTRTKRHSEAFFTVPFYARDFADLLFANLTPRTFRATQRGWQAYVIWTAPDAHLTRREYAQVAPTDTLVCACCAYGSSLTGIKWIFLKKNKTRGIR